MPWNGVQDALSVKIVRVQNWDAASKNYTLFMIPKPGPARLSISMEFIETVLANMAAAVQFGCLRKS